METRKNIFYNIILALSQVLFPLITFPYLARTLGPEHIGVINFAESFSRYFIAVAAFGIPIYGVREIAKVQNNLALRSQLLCEIFSFDKKPIGIYFLFSEECAGIKIKSKSFGCVICANK